MVITLAKLPLLLTPLTYIPVGKDAKHAKKLLILLNKLINSTSNAILHEGFTEIQQITRPHPGETEVAEQLFLVCIIEFLNTPGLYNNLVLNNEVGPEAFIKPDSLVLDGNGNLAFNLNPRCRN